jgi:hypothetical protein
MVAMADLPPPQLSLVTQPTRQLQRAGTAATPEAVEVVQPAAIAAATAVMAEPPEMQQPLPRHRS